jgi:serine/threonine-protein kinase
MRLHGEVGEASQLDQYTLEELIGQGGMGKVYKARHALLRRPTAVKILDGVEADRETVLRFEREVQLTSELTHPNTIQIYDYGRTRDEIFYYVMEYLPGLNLGELVAISGALPAGRVIHLLRQICGSLAEAHGRGLIHRDIKPANIMLCDRGGLFDVIKVLDFGLARSSQPDQSMQITKPQSLGGTPQFIAPERIRDPSVLDNRSDLYALGAVAFFLLAGRHVFAGKSTADLFYQVMNVAPVRLGSDLAIEVPSELDDLVATCLAKDPEERPESMAEVLKTLDKLAETLPWSQEDARLCWEKIIVRHQTGFARQSDVRLAHNFI